MRRPDPRQSEVSDAPRAIVVRTAGTNCDVEMDRAFRLAGADPVTVHLDTLCKDPAPIKDASLIGFPGGFSYGDDIASGRIFAMRVRRALAEPLIAAVERGACIIGICNGFQVLVQTGLLPGDASGGRSVALSGNEHGRFVDDWVGVVNDPVSPCVWTRGLERHTDPEILRLPIANGEGRFVANEETIERLEAEHRIALRYAHPVNGSARDIAGICDGTGRIFGLMPHPERYLDWTRHPFWTRLSDEQRRGATPGLQIFVNAVEAVTGVHA